MWRRGGGGLVSDPTAFQEAGDEIGGVVQFLTMRGAGWNSGSTGGRDACSCMPVIIPKLWEGWFSLEWGNTEGIGK